MSAAEFADPGAMSCRRGGTWAVPGSSGDPTASDDRAGTRDEPLEKIERRWTLQILLCLNAGEQRFADLRSAIPRVSANILTDRLRALECAGLVERRYLPPPHASNVYALTEIANGLRPVLDALASWRAVQSAMYVHSRALGE